jgi:hypothetical protein
MSALQQALSTGYWSYCGCGNSWENRAHNCQTSGQAAHFIRHTIRCHMMNGNELAGWWLCIDYFSKNRLCMLLLYAVEAAGKVISYMGFLCNTKVECVVFPFDSRTIATHPNHHTGLAYSMKCQSSSTLRFCGVGFVCSCCAIKAKT